MTRAPRRSGASIREIDDLRDTVITVDASHCRRDHVTSFAGALVSCGFATEQSLDDHTIPADASPEATGAPMSIEAGAPGSGGSAAQWVTSSSAPAPYGLRITPSASQ